MSFSVGLFFWCVTICISLAQADVLKIDSTILCNSIPGNIPISPSLKSLGKTRTPNLFSLSAQFSSHLSPSISQGWNDYPWLELGDEVLLAVKRTIGSYGKWEVSRWFAYRTQGKSTPKISLTHVWNSAMCESSFCVKHRFLPGAVLKYLQSKKGYKTSPWFNRHTSLEPLL